ncbi:magnesium transport protein cora [Echria macrotheca]|uniref:Magnesium transport protein cora n=1 Tax=Echria macrotheca TaxID=438768 RepID=A0AAJ0F3W9_9PEZI|nr:magnesium transport protein cora [Echria macrotheca]
MSRPATCISGKPHDHHVSDVTIHYNGCLRASKRDKFFQSLSPESRARIIRDNEKIAELRHRLETAQCDSTAAARLRTFKQAMTQWSAAVGRPYVSYAFDDSRRPSGMVGYASEDLVNEYIKAPVYCFQNGRPVDMPGVPGRFPSQKVTVADLLSDDETRNPLMQPVDDDVVRYFHLPANNMMWVEEIMARYYHEKRPDSDDLFMGSKLRRTRTRTETLLRPEYWQGQQNFEPNAEVHARHMRPFCDGISVDFSAADRTPKNLALFMPYLHWETDRGRVKSAEIIKEVNKQMPRSMSEVVASAQNQLHQTQTQDTTTPVWVAPEPGEPGQEKIDRRMALGFVFRTAAALMEAIDFHTEEQLMMKYLHAQPPLHPRRTLDQSYYGALKSTRARDRDQVVYRGTTPEHHDCIGMDACEQCNEDIRKVPRIIMVDQLWLWILDEKTVISFFPRRWGKNRPDPSAVHKSIRVRLQYARPGEVASAYDLALMIVDECSRVFFDRARTGDRKPNLIELFAGAIRDLTYKQTAAFDQFLIYTHLASRDYKRERYSAIDNDSTQNTLLNINPEGNLLKEVKDVVDEILIMMRIKEQQQTAMESLVKHIRRVMMPMARPRKATPSQVSTSWDVVLGAAMDGENGPYVDDEEHDKRERARQTLTRADHLLADLSERISELQALLQIAQNTSASLKDILTLKQQQAGVIEAREAVKQAELTLKQGQSIMIFTIVTIIFLPLSFCVGFFGMNAAELNDGHLTLDTELRFMLPISAGIILLAFVFAFSQSILSNAVVALARSGASFGYNTVLTWVMVKTGLYVAGREMKKSARRLRDRENKITGAMKAEVMRKEKNLEKMRAANHVRQLAARKERGRLGDDAVVMASGRTTPFSPYTTGGGGASPFVTASPFMGGQKQMSEVDVELGERVHTGRRLA